MADNTKPSKKALRYYAIRLPEDMLEQLHEMKEVETRRLGVPVYVSGLCRRFIMHGMRELALEHKRLR